MLDIAFARPSLPRTGALVLLVPEGAEPSGLWQAADAATGGAVSRAFAAASFKGGAGKTCTILAPGDASVGLTRIVAVGLGKEAATRRSLEEAGGHAAAALGRDGAASIAADALDATAATALALGAALRSYRFDRYRTKEKPDDKPKLARLTVLTEDAVQARTAWTAQKAIADGVFLSRDLVSEPANVLNPAEMARRCEALTALGLKVEVLGPKELERLGFGALLGVSQGSANEPRVVVMHWRGLGGDLPGDKSGDKAGDKSGDKPGKAARAKAAGAKAAGAKAAATVREASRPIAFIGKGVTFDTGGISIKPAAGMEDMKWDMAGAGAVIGLMAALAGRRAKVDAVGIVGLVENMPGDNAQRPGDVVTSLSGQTIEVINTDAEGRLVLADVLWYCKEKFDPLFMIDLATLTGAIIIGLGHEYGGLFANNDELAQRLTAAGTESGEKLWRMPLGDAYDRQIKSDIADMKNVGGRPGGSITAAQFVQRFVDGRPWAHLDIAGMAWSSKDAACTPKGATAFGVRLLDQLVADHYESR